MIQTEHTSGGKHPFEGNKLVTLFFLKLKDEGVYQLGTSTDRSMKSYLGDEGENIESILDVTFANGEEAKMMEEEIIEKYRDLFYHGPNLPLMDKGSQLFREDISIEIKRLLENAVLLEYVS
jgi:hypothetical protein